MANIKELSKIPERLSGGHRLCAGCGASIAVRQVLMGTEDPVVVAAATGCLEVATTIYPYTAWNVPFIHNAFENVAATLSGAETAYKAFKKQGKISEDKDIKFIAFGGDGGTYDIGLQSLSGTLERGHDFVYVCLPPETELILGDGSIIKIGEFVDEKIENKIIKEPSLITNSNYNFEADSGIGYYKNEEVESVLIEKPKEVLSWNGREFLPMESIRAQRKNAPKSLIKITTSSGLTLKLTEEHPVLIDGPNGPEWKEAGLLTNGEEVYSVRKTNIFNKDKFYLIDLISENKSISVTLPYTVKAQINKELSNRFGTIKKASQNVPFKYWQFKERDRKVNLYDLINIYQQIPELNWENLRDNVSEFVVRGGNVVKIHQKQLDENMLYLLGLISSDGYIRKQNYGITFINKEISLIKTFEQTYLKTIEGRNVYKIKDEAGIWYLTIEDPIVYTLAKKFDIKNDPKELIKLPKSLIAAFLKGYFDGDGHCSILEHKYSKEARIILSTIKKILSDRIRLLLQRLGIVGFQDGREERFDIIISSKFDVKRFIESIGSNHPTKKAAMKKVKLLLKDRKLKGGYFSLAPKVCGKLLKEICKKHNISITSIDKDRNICTLAALKRRATKQKIREYLDKIERLVSKEPLIYKIKNFLLDDFYLDPIKKLEIVKAKSKYVYDLTIKPSHVFVPEGKFVISNCYDNEAYMNTGIQRSGATPTGASTTTAPAGKKSYGKPQFRKDLTAIVVAHNIPYAAQTTIGFWNDVVSKSQKAFNVKGPAFLNILSMCHRGWRFKQDDTIEISKLAVNTCFWPLYEVEDGEYRLTYKPKEKLPITEWLKPQGRFKHLFKPGNEKVIEDIQKEVDRRWEKILELCNETSETK